MFFTSHIQYVISRLGVKIYTIFNSKLLNLMIVHVYLDLSLINGITIGPAGFKYFICLFSKAK